jgi:RsiW-degrading membrane proteinase PrsW (M82 family)
MPDEESTRGPAGASTGGRELRSVAVPRWAWLVVLSAGLVLFLAVERTLVATGNPNFVPATILLGALLGPVTFVTYVYGRGAAWTVPLPVLGLVALFGGVFGMVVAGVLEYDTLRELGVVPTLIVGLIEESAKLAVPLALLLLTRYRSPADGLVVGITVGMAFAALETMGYGFVTLLRSGGNVGALEDVLLLRGLLSPAGHAAWTGLASTALFRAWSSRGEGHTGAALAGTFLLVVVLHGLWDGLGSLVGHAVIALVSLGLLRREVQRSLLTNSTERAVTERGDRTVDGPRT